VIGPGADRSNKGIKLSTREKPRPPRQINAWIEECAADPGYRLVVGEGYSLHLQIGRPRPDSLISGPDAAVPAEDVPAAGLATEWVVTSRDVEISSLSQEVVATDPSVEGAGVWTARFGLHVPFDGDSAVRSLRIVPRTLGEAHVCIAVYVGRELYRRVTIRLKIGARLGQAPLSIQGECSQTTERHLNLRAPQDWAVPAGELSITVFDDQAIVRADFAGQVVKGTVIRWEANRLAGRVDNARASAERLWTRWEKEFNDVDPDDLARRLRSFAPMADWSSLPDEADEAHRAAWSRLERSSELFDLAADGFQLFQAVCPAGGKLRGWLEALPPGSRFDVTWPDVDGAVVSNVPWGLLYLRPPVAGEPVDPALFFGLRFRIGYTVHDGGNASKALGAPGRSYRANLLYWGDHPADETGAEARRQQRAWADRPNQVFIPSASTDPGDAPRLQAVRLLDRPAPAPVSVLYLYCECKVGEGNDPVLSFGGSASDRLRRTELGLSALESRPLIFANACSTASSDPHRINELEAGFFERGCRAFLGTEIKVPIVLASRFATVFFELFERRLDPGPVAAGEALAQTRLFFWTRYRNLGGLFYTYINQYELFLADPEEVVELRV
jgi:hypothetical protein